jgi:hypothetical protein
MRTRIIAMSKILTSDIIVAATKSTLAAKAGTNQNANSHANPVGMLSFA